MQILVINSGSSSLKFSVFNASDPENPRPLQDGEIAGIGGPNARLKLDGKSQPISAKTPDEALHAALDAITPEELNAVGYRVVHPGPHLLGHQRITESVLHELEQAVPFSPLHDPAAIQSIRNGMARFPNLPHFACFDTEFHRTMPPDATTYPIPKQFRDAGIRRYGFHGLSCESIVRQLAAGPGIPRRMVIAHLGSGCSVTALLDGKSVDTSMGLTPTGGVVMGTRPGDLDPGLVLYLLRQPNMDPDTLEKLLNHEAGLVALSGMPNDVQAMRQAAEGGNPQATLALQVFTRAITKTIGGFAWLLGGLDAIIFAGGIGEHDPATRAAILPPAGLDKTRNEANSKSLRRIDAPGASTAIYVIPAEEDLMIAIHVARMTSPPDSSTPRLTPSSASHN